ncbi:MULTISPECIES: peptidoglycan-binding protein [unclassified Streptomyces]|uniref:peptidoglycan recognition protein family protein n=1 Tax=unclassified Streptomyces TaxID=2593676 RepID=UPI000B07B36C|nr:peptidoglycan-binding protein [Streptomyces sp. CNQ-509]
MRPGPVYVSRRTALKAGAGAVLVAGGGGALLLGGSAAADGGTSLRRTADDPSYVIGTGDWGARPPSGTVSVSSGTTTKIVVHHTAFPNTTDYSYEAAVFMARKIQDLHMDDNGWIDSGQHFTISRGGYVLEGRHGSLEALADGGHQVVSAHAVGENRRAIGIENDGHYVNDTPTPALVFSLQRLCVTIGTQYGFGADRIFGHWDFNDTQCPGALFYREFPALRRQVAQVLGQGPDEIPERTWPDTYTSSKGGTVEMAQRLLRAYGYELKADGVYGPATLEAVHTFQRTMGLPTADDGTLDNATWEALTVPVSTGHSGEAVLAVQQMLVRKLHLAKATGKYNGPTTKAVAEMQELHGLPATGAMDVATWCATAGGIVREEFMTA